ncbi:MAG: hypothetical protein K6E42_09845 [Synergistes sp.]|nr:hypothetical protein [Synergistes sp.]
MYFANDENGQRIYIDDAQKRHMYVCPACNEPVIMKCGEVVSHHFSHKAKKNCDPWYTDKMSAWHRKFQNIFPYDAREQIVRSRDNKVFHIADVLFQYKGEKYVIEFQHSPISRKEFNLRSQFYLDLGYNLFWVFDFCECEAPKRIYYDRFESEKHIINLIWPGKDRIRFLDEIDLLEYADKGRLHVFFHISVGAGQLSLHYGSYGFSWYTWEYIDPKQQERCFVEPRYLAWDSLSEFEAIYYKESRFLDLLNNYSTKKEPFLQESSTP